jgi:hypothetical protein
MLKTTTHNFLVYNTITSSPKSLFFSPYRHKKAFYNKIADLFSKKIKLMTTKYLIYTLLKIE